MSAGLSSSRITVLIPTLNRSDFMLRTLRYYAELKYDGKLLVGDSSGPMHTAKIRAFLKGYGAGLDVTYLECPELNDRQTVLKLAALVETPYATLHGDDDMIFPTAAARCAEFLDTHEDYASAHGRAWLFTVATERGVNGRMALGGDYPLPTASAESPLARLEALLSRYTVTLFSLHRRSAWQAMWRDVDRADRSFGAEVLPCSRSVVYGKCAALDVPYLLRQVHGARYHLPSQAPWRSAPGWQTDFDFVCDALAADVRTTSMGHETPTREDIARLFERTYLDQRDPVPSSRDRLVSALERWPRIDGALRRAQAALRLTRVREGYELEFAREIDLFVAMTSRSAPA